MVTGASFGIGEATRTLAARGFHVVAVARQADQFYRAGQPDRRNRRGVADNRDDAAVEALTRALSRVGVLVSNASGKGFGSSPCRFWARRGCGTPTYWARCR